MKRFIALTAAAIAATSVVAAPNSIDRRDINRVDRSVNRIDTVSRVDRAIGRVTRDEQGPSAREARVDRVTQDGQVGAREAHVDRVSQVDNGSASVLNLRTDRVGPAPVGVDISPRDLGQFHSVSDLASATGASIQTTSYDGVDMLRRENRR